MDTQMFLIILMEQKELNHRKYVHKVGHINALQYITLM